MKIILAKIESDYYMYVDEKIPYVKDGGTEGIFICLDEIPELNIFGNETDLIVTNVGSCSACRKLIATTKDIEGTELLSIDEMIVMFENRKYSNKWTALYDYNTITKFEHEI